LNACLLILASGFLIYLGLRPLQKWRSGFRQKAALFISKGLRRSAETPLRLMNGFAAVSIPQNYENDDSENMSRLKIMPLTDKTPVCGLASWTAAASGARRRF